MGLSKNIKNAENISNNISLGIHTFPSEQIEIYRKIAEKTRQDSHVQREKRREKAWRSPPMNKNPIIVTIDTVFSFRIL